MTVTVTDPDFDFWSSIGNHSVTNGTLVNLSGIQIVIILVPTVSLDMVLWVGGGG